MFWPLQLPFLLTVTLMAALLATATYHAPRLKTSRARALTLGALLALLAFIPACSGIGFVVDRFRFGAFSYADFADVNDFRVQRFLPPAARDITVKKHASGFIAKYRIYEPELSAFLDELWAQHGAQSSLQRNELSPGAASDEQQHQVNFDSQVNWPFIPGMKIHPGPVAPTGASFTIWYSAGAGIAYQRAAYW